MQRGRHIQRVFFALAVCLGSLASAQLPTATGRSFTLSDPAWKVFIPSTYQSRGPVADVLVHFHGDSQTFWNNARYANLNTIILTSQYGSLSSAYQTPFVNNPALFANILNEALGVVRNQPDFVDNLQWDKMGVSSFSAGYAAVREILKNPTHYNDIDALIMSDTIYASFTSSSDHTPLDSQMVNFRSFALAAKNGSKSFILTHSQVPTFTYSNTIETADDILGHINLTATPTNATGLGGIQFYRQAAGGNFWMRGATGTDGDSHLAHLRYSGPWLTQIPLAHVPEPSVVWVLLLMPVGAMRRRD